MVGEVVRRITGRSLGTYFRDEIAQPLGLDLHIGLAEAEHHRVAEMSEIPTDQIDPDSLGLAQVIFSDPQSMAALSFIMIHVGYEFEIDKSRPRVYAVDFGVAMSAATLRARTTTARDEPVGISPVLPPLELLLNLSQVH